MRVRIVLLIQRFDPGVLNDYLYLLNTYGDLALQGKNYNASKIVILFNIIEVTENVCMVKFISS